jgi:predicted 3-demethylubiquinone-9 3-methyltransferase (glyoxalase superfamily)
MQKITPFLWFNGTAEAAAALYVSAFRHATILNTKRGGNGGPWPPGSVVSVTVSLDGTEVTLFNGGPNLNFTSAISLFVNCETQHEIDTLWDKLSAGGEILQCGWLKDKFGVSWQIVPRQLGDLLFSNDAARAERVLKVMMGMRKLNIAELEAANHV